MDNSMDFDSTRKMLEFLSEKTNYKKRVFTEAEVREFYDLNKFRQKDFIKEKSLSWAKSGKGFPEAADWAKHIGILKKYEQSIEDDSAWLILMELRQAAQSGDDTNLTDQARSVLRAHGLSFYDYRYQDKARDKVTITSILQAFRAMSKLHTSSRPMPAEFLGSLPDGVEKWKNPITGKELLIYPQGMIPGDKKNNDRIRNLGRTIDDKKGPWYDHSRPFAERLKLMMDDVDRQLGRGKYNTEKEESMLERRKKLITDLGMDIKNFGDLT